MFEQQTQQSQAAPVQDTQTQTGFEQVQQQAAQPGTATGTGDNTQQIAQGGAEQVITPEQYRALQSEYTQTRQFLATLTQNNSQLAQQMLTMQAQLQSQQQTVAPQQSMWDLENPALMEKLNTDPKGTLQTLIRAEAEKLANDMVNPIKADLTATQQIINTQRVDNTLSGLQAKYGNLPVYKSVMDRAVDYITGPGLAAAKANPAEALERQFRFELYSEVERNPQLLSQFQQAQQQFNQQVIAGKQMASPMTTSSNVQQSPHQPLQQPMQQGQLTPQQLARQISTFDEPQFMYGNKQFNAQFHES